MKQGLLVSEDSGALEELYREESSKLWRALLAFTTDPEIASDAVAEAFARALKYEATIRDARAWIWRVAFRVARSELDRSRPLLTHEADESYQAPDPVPELLSALRKLSPNQRLAVVLHDYADRPVSEVARVLGSSRATVYVHLSQGRRRLRNLMGGSNE